MTIDRNDNAVTDLVNGSLNNADSVNHNGHDVDTSFAKEILSQIESVLNGTTTISGTVNGTINEPIYSRNDLSKETNGFNSPRTINNNNCTANGQVNNQQINTDPVNCTELSNYQECAKESISTINTTWNPFSCHTLTNLCWDRDSLITLDQYVSAYSVCITL